MLPDVPEVACFDTAFHAHLPEAAATYALPAELAGASTGSGGTDSTACPTRTPPAGSASCSAHVPPRLVVCHLGAGASLCAVADGRSVDTTMGFTPLEGLVMATRSGSVDPGLLLWLQEREDLSPAELADTLEYRSGPARPRRHRRHARDRRRPGALEVYLHRLRAGIAAMAASLGGLDTLVFTGGVGEHAARRTPPGSGRARVPRHRDRPGP